MTAENNKDRRTSGIHTLSGREIIPGPDRPYRTFGEAAKKQGETRRITGGIGKKNEKIAIGYWSGNVRISHQALEEIKECRKNIIDTLGIKGKEYFYHTELAEHYQQLGKIPPIPMEPTDPVLPQFQPDLIKLAQIVDTEFETDYVDLLSATGNNPNGSSNEPNPNIRYVAEGLLTVSNIVLSNSNIPDWHILGDQYITATRTGNLLTQIDAAVIKTSDSLNEPMPKNLEEVWGHGHQWMYVQIKNPQRPRHITGEIKRPFPRHVDQIKHQLARLIADRYEADFNLPSSLRIIYLRGIKDIEKFDIRVDHYFIQKWFYDLERSFDAGLFSAEQMNEVAPVLQYLNDLELELREERRRRFEENIDAIQEIENSAQPGLL